MNHLLRLAFLTSLTAALPAQTPELDLYVSSRDTHSIKRFDGSTGQYRGDFVVPRAGGLANPEDLAFGPDDHLWVRDQTGTAVLVFHRDTGAFVRRAEELPATADPETLHGVARGPDDVRERTGLRFSVLESKIRRSIISTDTPYGFKIRSVDEDSPAAAAGLEKGHILMKWDGEPLRTIAQLRKVLRETESDTEVAIEYSARVGRASLFHRHPWRTRQGTITLR